MLRRQILGEPDHMHKRTGGGAPPPESPIAAAIYIGTMAEELSQMARRHGLDSLRYILDMARLEADQIAKSAGDGNGDAA
jgi:hypothetical protein